MNRDAEAIEAIRRGDTERYGELVERYQRAVYGIAWSRLGDANLCEEAVQETFVQGFRYLGGLRKPERFPAWIARIAHNMAVAIGRGRRRELDRRERWSLDELPSPPYGGPPTPVVHAKDEPVGETLSQALSALPDAHRESLVLFYLEGKSVREAAGLLGISEGAFKVRLHRARGKLREAMEERLERSLRELAPRKGLPERILAVVPAFPLGWGVQAGALGSLFAVLVPVLAAILGALPGLAFVWYSQRRLAQNYREQGGYRQALVKRNAIKLCITLVVMFGLLPLVMHAWGMRGALAIVGLLGLPAIVRALQLLRVNGAAYNRALLLWVCTMEGAVVAFVFFRASLAWYFLAMALLWPVLLWARRHRLPRPRADYNLFLRAAHGELGEVQADVTPGRTAGREDLREFARFLGELSLAVDYSLRGSGPGAECTLYSPPMAGRPLMPFRWCGESTISILGDGTCAAHFSNADLRVLVGLNDGRALDARELERRVAGVVRATLARFLSGDTAGAQSLVEAVPDEAIFRQPPHRLITQRVAFVVGFLVFLALFLVCLFGGLPVP